jgi:hypothetical protein
MKAQCVINQDVWASANYTLYLSRDAGDSFSKVAEVPGPFWARLLGKFRLFERSLRLGIKSIRVLKSGTILAIAGGKIIRGQGDKFSVVHSFQNGLGPAREGWCEDGEGNCYAGEYFLNNRRKYSVNLLKSTDDGQTWRVIHSLSGIRHIHCVQYDPFENKIWMGTGDRDDESYIAFSGDGGMSWLKIGSGDQIFRAVSLIFTEDAVYWGTDIPTRQNNIYKYHRRSQQLERLTAVDGTVHSAAILGNGIKVISTAAEGNSEGKNPEWDQKAHIWASQDGTSWEDIISWSKDSWPYVMGYGRVIFAQEQAGDDLYFTTESLKSMDGAMTHARLTIAE